MVPVDDRRPEAYQAPVTHYCRWDEPGRRLVRALCGALIQRRAHRNDPTCPRCAAALAERERAVGP